jgi:hypothetical protein
VGSKAFETVAGTAAAVGSAAAAALGSGVNSLSELAGDSMGSNPFRWAKLCTTSLIGSAAASILFTQSGSILFRLLLAESYPSDGRCSIVKM